MRAKAVKKVPIKERDVLRQKKCSKCGILLPETEEYFVLNKCRTRKRFALRPECRKCLKEKLKVWNIKNIKQKKENDKNYYLKNIEERKAYANKHHLKNKERHKKLQHELYIRDKERIVYKIKLWKSKNKDRVLATCRNRRARLKGARGSHSAEDIYRQLLIQKNKCYWCNDKMNNKYHVDHLIPISKGGSNSKGNIVVACPTCNLSKNDKLPYEFSGRLL